MVKFSTSHLGALGAAPAPAARGRTPPGIRAAMHPRRVASLWEAFRPGSAAIRPRERLANPASRRSRWARRFAHGLLVLLAGCSASSALPPSRGLITLSGARVPPDPARMDSIDIWLRPELQNIEEDPTFLIVTDFSEVPVMPWEDFVIEGDTARLSLDGGLLEARAVYLVYAHLHLMHRLERLEEWLPDAAGLAGYELERAIVARTADVWFYGRSLYGWAPYLPLDELLFSSENGYLDAYLLTARAEEFALERDAWLDESAGAQEAYRTWFRSAFETNPPGLR